MYFDFTYLILVLPAAMFAMWASSKVQGTYQQYSKQLSKKGMTAEVACRQVLDSNGLVDVKIERIPGKLTDHFDPRSNIIRLSDSVYGNTSTAAIGVACHEAGHAIQYAEGYAPIKLRNAIIPLTNIGAKLSMPLIFLGFILGSSSQEWIFLAYIGIALYGLVALFQLFTLPTEFDASKRALTVIESHAILDEEELLGSKKVLDAAALTYVAALAVTLMQILRFLILVNRRRR